MKILILYTPRSGTNSISSYFLKQNSNYEYFNQPFSEYDDAGVRRASYSDCLKYENVLVKSDILNFTNLRIKKDQLLNDFDKILLISRKDKREQAISFIIAAYRQNYLDNSKRSYFTGSIPEEEIEKMIDFEENWHFNLEKYMDIKIPLFYYEDLYYGSFNDLFKFLGVEYIEEDFINILDIKNRYKIKDLENKKINTLV